MKHIVTIHKDGKSFAETVPNGTRLFELLQLRSALPESPCGGRGTCGKCAVRVSGLEARPSDKESSLLGSAKIERGFRLACYVKVESDLEVYVEGGEAVKASIVTGGIRREVLLDPLVTKEYVEMSLPTLENQTSDMDRLMSSSETRWVSFDTEILRDLPETLRHSGYKVTLVGIDGKLAAVESGNTEDKLFGAAFDIGTTTVAAYLYNLRTGECPAIGSMLNPQRKYGADVITRISHAMKSKDAAIAMQSFLINGINELLEELAVKAGIRSSDIYMSVFSGNTTMMHLLMGLDTSGMAISPFIPVTTDLLRFSPGYLKLSMNPGGVGAVLPCVSAYVGADTVAGVLSSGMYEKEEISLLVDIGTNGEIVLGCRDWMISCSMAAGPAFEGANISNGVGGVAGAIDSVGKAPGFAWTTIGNEKPIGICGSGIIDLTAALLDAGLMDETGRLVDEEEAAELDSVLAGRMVTIDGMRAFCLIDEGENGSASRIAMTQKDIRELQNAKAAVAAGIDTLIKRSGIRREQIAMVYLAGGFGSMIHMDSALKIGLLPGEFSEKTVAVGNASGTGASEGLLSKEMLALTEQLRKRVKYVELSASADFSESYVENMLFGSVFE